MHIPEPLSTTRAAISSSSAILIVCLLLELFERGVLSRTFLRIMKHEKGRGHNISMFFTFSKKTVLQCERERTCGLPCQKSLLGPHKKPRVTHACAFVEFNWFWEIANDSRFSRLRMPIGMTQSITNHQSCFFMNEVSFPAIVLVIHTCALTYLNQKSFY